MAVGPGPTSSDDLSDVVLQHMAESVCLVRAGQYTIVYTNPRFDQMFGYGPGELLDQPVVTLNAPSGGHSPEEVSAGIARLLEAHGEATTEIHCRRKDGSTFWTRAHISAFDHPRHGRVWISVSHDITAEKEAIAKLAQQERLLRLVVESLPVGVWIGDAEGVLQSSNAAARRIWGGARYVGIEDFDEYRAWHLDSGAPVSTEEWGLSRAVRQGETTIGQPLRIQTFDGTFRTILNSAIPLRDEHGAIVGAVVVNEDVTALKEAEARFAGVVAAAPDAIISTDERLRITMFNGEAEALFGYAESEVRGLPIEHLLSERHRHDLRLRLTLMQVPTLRYGDAEALTGRRKNGGEFPIEAGISRLLLAGAAQYTLVLRDISARKRGEAERKQLHLAVQHERTWLRAVVSAAPVGIIAIDVGGGVVASARAQVVCGIELTEEVRRSGYGGILRRPDGTPVSVEELPSTRVLRSGAAILGEEFFIQRPDGMRCDVVASCVPAYGPDGRLLGAVGVFDDVTEQRRAEAEQRFLARAATLLADSLEYETTLDQVVRLAVPEIADGCLIDLLNDAGEVEPASAFCAEPERLAMLREALRRYPRRGAARGGGRVIATGTPELVSDLQDSLWPEISNSPENLAALRRLGITSYVSVPLMAHGATIGALTLFMVESRRRFEPRDLPLCEALARSASLAIDNACLYRTAQRATATRNEVLGIVAHDLRSPLGNVKLAARMLANPRAGDETKASAMGIIERSIERMNRLVQDLLDVARMEGGGLAVKPTAQPPGELVGEALEAARPSAAGVELRAAIAAGLPPVAADRGRVLQVFANLIGNALKFTPAGGRITVAAAQQDEHEVCFSVRDSGAGIPREHLARVFDRFWQGRRADSRGAGLGLTICKGLVEAHGGKIWAESTLGLGTTVHFTLPIQRPPAS